MTRKSERNKNEATKIFAADDEHIEGGQNDNLVDEVLKIADDDNQEVGYAIGMPQEAYSFKKKKKKLISFAYKILLPGLLLYLVYTKLQLSQKNEQLETVLGNLETKEMKMNEAIKASSEVSESEYAELAEDEQKVEYLENTIAKLEMQRKENKMETNKLEILLQQGNKKLEKKNERFKSRATKFKTKTKSNCERKGKNCERKGKNGKKARKNYRG